MKSKTMMAVWLILSAAGAQSAGPQYGPIIEGYGPVYPIIDRDVPLPAGHTYRVVFDAKTYTGEPSSLNKPLESVARFINMHGVNGVKLENMDIAVVVHGPALAAVLSDGAYEERNGIANPNSTLLSKLKDAGVRFYVCGQSMAFRGVDKEELADAAEVALSAMTMFATLQSEGYALLP